MYAKAMRQIRRALSFPMVTARCHSSDALEKKFTNVLIHMGPEEKLMNVSPPSA